MNIEIQSVYFSGFLLEGEIGSSHLILALKLTPPNKNQITGLAKLCYRRGAKLMAISKRGETAGGTRCSCWKSLVQVWGLLLPLDSLRPLTLSQRTDAMISWSGWTRVWCSLQGSSVGCWGGILHFGSQLEVPEGYKNVVDLKLVDRTGVNYTHWENTWKSTTTPL